MCVCVYVCVYIHEYMYGVYLLGSGLGLGHCQQE